MAQHPVSPADLVGDHFGIVLQQLVAGIPLVGRHLGDHALEPAQDGLLAFAEGRLVGDLEQVAK